MSLLRITRCGLIFILAALLAYLFFWPVALEPVAWDAPTDAGLVDPFAVNDRLAKADLVSLGPDLGPEDIAEGTDGLLYATTSSGKILRFGKNGLAVEVFAEVGGRPLGIEFDADGNLIVANAYIGLQSVQPDGHVTLLVDEFKGARIGYSNDVAVANDGTIFFSDASAKFAASEFGGTYAASLIDILEHGGNGRVFRFSPDSGDISILISGLNFANGIAISNDQRFLLISETGSYQILRYWLRGASAGTYDVLLQNLPGFPDNINNGLNGKFWVGLVAPRSALLDRLANRPSLRKLVQRLPPFMRPAAEPSSHVIAVAENGDVLMNLQDTSARLPALTGVYESADALWLSSLFGGYAGKLAKRDLAN
ncbi:MAG: SMP-30/gluconolactonase/LRE family protein [Woeseiaceae bacterium]